VRTATTTEIPEQRFATDEDRWSALLRRDRAADGVFYYAVRTTGVYCRPSCAARRARRENVSFHVDRADAERAGFRPCKRCRPDDPAPEQRRSELIAAACRLIETAENAPDLDTLATAAGLSRYHFHRLFKEAVGMTPRAYVMATRARRLREELAGHATVTEAIFDAGFNSNARFYATAPASLGMTPTAYRRGGAGETVRFAVGDCSLGTILVAATSQGICAILLGDDAEALIRDLQDRFPRAYLVGGDAEFERTVGLVIGYVEQPSRGLDLPLDVRGTAFQQRVWQALRAIPAGERQSYAQVAARLGEPHAARAVAQACSANPLAVAIPCHRVVRTDGALSGYRWGLARKQVLLEREAAS
jgi:AraC family transcriptional regulator of adaptative response/methylated-DNA-[protein]-cysteine methyltransferase